MKKLFNFSINHKGSVALTGHVIRLVLSIIMLAFFFSFIGNPFAMMSQVKDTRAEVEERSQVVQAATDYIHGVSTDTSDVPAHIVDAVEAQRETVSAIIQAQTMASARMQSFLDNCEN